MIASGLEPLLHSTLTAFARAILDTPWFGKEREAVSYYAFGFLAKACKPGTLLFDPGQLAIEGRIPGTRSHSKKQVCKDLVIWPAPGANCWDGPKKAVHAPLAIIEWKANSSTFFEEDITKMMEYTTSRHPGPDPGSGLLGIVVTFDAKKKGVLRAAKVLNGVVEREWLEAR